MREIAFEDVEAVDDDDLLNQFGCQLKKALEPLCGVLVAHKAVCAHRRVFIRFGVCEDKKGRICVHDLEMHAINLKKDDSAATPQGEVKH